MSLHFATADDVDAWLCGPGSAEPEAWLVVARKGHAGLTADEAGDVALCHGWIDSHRKRLNEHQFLQRYSPRRSGSPWSQMNVDRAESLMAAGRMRPRGHAEVAAARADGRWASAYQRQRTATVPPQLAADLPARAAFDGLSRTAQYALFLPILKARTDRTRATALRNTLSRLARSSTSGMGVSTPAG
jgi:uncharacterized protein YdeI (YjbR/CyaY-like superfamily)